MDNEAQAKVLHLLDVISVVVVAIRNDTRSLQTRFDGLESRFDGLESRFDRLDHRLGRVETRLEGVETELRLFRHEFERRTSRLERAVGL